jgi:hypothetical protein
MSSPTACGPLSGDLAIPHTDKLDKPGSRSSYCQDSQRREWCVGHKLFVYDLIRGSLVFHDRGIGNRKTALVFVDDLPLFGGFAPVKFFGRINIQIVAAITLLELHQ